MYFVLDKEPLKHLLTSFEKTVMCLKQKLKRIKVWLFLRGNKTVELIALYVDKQVGDGLSVSAGCHCLNGLHPVPALHQVTEVMPYTSKDLIPTSSSLGIAHFC